MPRSLARVLALTVLLAGCAGATSGAAAPSPSPATAATPDVTLFIVGGRAGGTWRSDAAAGSSNCLHNADGSWRLLYSGGDPWFSVDLIVGAHASEPGSKEVALEVQTTLGYVWLDPAHIRGGDKDGRSTVKIEIQPGAAATTFVVSGTTPDDKWRGDGQIQHISMTATCPLV